MPYIFISCNFNFSFWILRRKALDTASRACKDGGTIIFLAECADGLGRGDFLNWFEAENSTGLAEKLCESYQDQRANGVEFIAESRKIRCSDYYFARRKRNALDAIA